MAWISDECVSLREVCRRLACDEKTLRLGIREIGLFPNRRRGEVYRFDPHDIGALMAWLAKRAFPDRLTAAEIARLPKRWRLPLFGADHGRAPSATVSRDVVVYGSRKGLRGFVGMTDEQIRRSLLKLGGSWTKLGGVGGVQ